MVAVITPDDIPEAKNGIIPDNVKRVWNEFIAKAYTNGRAVVLQDDIIPALMEAMGTLDRSVVFANNWLNIEELYEQAGWNVAYDKPAYNESYPATFTFTAKG